MNNIAVIRIYKALKSIGNSKTHKTDGIKKATIRN